MGFSIQTPSDAAVCGIRNLLDDYISLNDLDYVLVCFWHECRETVAWIMHELEERNQCYQIYPYSHRDSQRFSNDVNQHIEKIKNKNLGNRKIVILVCEEEVLAFSPILRSLNKDPNIFVWRMMNTSPHLFEQAFSIEKEKLKNINAWLLSKLNNKPITKLKITNKYGTNLDITLNNNKYHWISTYGVAKKNELIILPTGEINTYPESVNGVFLAFGAIHANIPLPFDTRLENKSVKLEIEDSLVKNFECENKYLNYYLSNVFKQSRTTTVGEFGIGTNIGITTFVPGNSHINERFPGVHLGLGMHLQKNNTMYKTAIHMDFISPYGQIGIEGQQEFIYLDQLSPIETLHPDNISAEDGE